MAAKPPKPSGVPLIDALVGIEDPEVDDYLAAASEYILLAGGLDQDQKKKAQIRGSAALGRVALAKLQERLPKLGLGAQAGEHNVSGALRIVKADVSELHPLDGLRLGIEIKPVLLAVGRAIWNRFGDVRTFAVNLHLKFPFAVVGGIMPIPIWEETKPGSGVRRDTRGKIDRLVGRFYRAGSRRTEGDAPHLLEGVAVVVFDPDTGTLDPHLPPTGLGLRWDEFFDKLGEAYEARFEE